MIVMIITKHEHDKAGPKVIVVLFRNTLVSLAILHSSRIRADVSRESRGRYSPYVRLTRSSLPRVTPHPFL